MKADDLFDILGGIVLIGLVTTIVTSPNTAKQITAAGGAFSGMMTAALGGGIGRKAR